MALESSDMEKMGAFVASISPAEWAALQQAIARPFADLPEPERSDRLNIAIGQMVRDGSLLRLLQQKRARQRQEEGRDSG